MTMTLPLLLLLLLPSCSSITCYSCTDYTTRTSSVLPVESFQEYVIERQSWSLLTDALNRTCDAWAYKQCPGARDICISGSLRTSFLDEEEVGDEDYLGMIQLNDCANPWVERNFCDKAVEGLAAAGMTADCYIASCSVGTECNVPDSLRDENTSPITASVATQTAAPVTVGQTTKPNKEEQTETPNREEDIQTPPPSASWEDEIQTPPPTTEVLLQTTETITETEVVPNTTTSIYSEATTSASEEETAAPTTSLENELTTVITSMGSEPATIVPTTNAGGGEEEESEEDEESEDEEDGNENDANEDGDDEEQDEELTKEDEISNEVEEPDFVVEEEGTMIEERNDQEGAIISKSGRVSCGMLLAVATLALCVVGV